MEAVDYRDNVSTDHRSHHCDGLMADVGLRANLGDMDKDVNIRIWRFAAEEESTAVHEEQSLVGKPIRKSKT